MAEKKSGWDAWNKKQARKALRKLHTGYIAVMAICLVIGAAAGAFFAHLKTANDGFTLNGTKEKTVYVGETLKYEDEGIKCISMGEDLSDKVEIKTNMTRSEDGKTFTGDTSFVGEYYIEYKITEGRYAGLSRVRIFTVSPKADNVE